MIKLYVSPSCTSCRKARKWLEDNDLEFKEKNIFHQPLTNEEIKQILSLTENGTEDIISYRSQAYKNLKVDIEDLSMHELLDLFQSEPTLIRRPIIMDDKRLQIGYNEEDIRCFLPRKIRKLEREKMYDQLAANE